MRFVIKISDIKKAVVFSGPYLRKKYFSEIAVQIKKLPSDQKLLWVTDFLREKGYKLVDICGSTECFPGVGMEFIV